MSSTALINVSLVLFSLYLLIGSLATASGKIWLLDALHFNPVARLPEFIYGITACRLVQRGLVINVSLIQKGLVFVPYLVYNYVFGGASDPLSIALVIPPFILLIVSGASSDIAAYNIGTRAPEGDI